MTILTSLAGRPSRAVSYLLVCLEVTALACGSTGLSRDDAKQAITIHLKLPKEDTYQTDWEYLVRADQPGLVFKVGISDYGTDVLTRRLDIEEFLARGLLASTPIFTPQRGTEIRVSFPSHMNQYERPSDNRYQFGVKICDVVFGDITGISEEEGTGTAEVEYSLRRTNWTPFGDYYRRDKPRTYPELSTGHRIRFKRWDDGWRIDQ